MIGWCGNMRLIDFFWNSLNNCVFTICHTTFQEQKNWLWALKCVERYVIFIGLVLNLNPNVRLIHGTNTTHIFTIILVYESYNHVKLALVIIIEVAFITSFYLKYKNILLWKNVIVYFLGNHCPLNVSFWMKYIATFKRIIMLPKKKHVSSTHLLQ